MAWLLLAGAIISEVTATLALRGIANGFRPLPALIVVVGYLVSFALMAVALRTLNVGIVYAVWSGAGTAGTAAIAAALYDERLNLTAVAGMVVIVAGVILLASSGATTHE
ncbi:MAG: small multidrug resistance pump [Streptosporangiaceae bacterium]|jgi:small multidrug resistance pump|nr:putative integral rane protein [Streptosporangiaceae bacterium]MDX6429098.1 small multidrug resistance pump [Streptosporangiaceae bacterium]